MKVLISEIKENWILYALTLILGTIGGSSITALTPLRHDPFTGTDGKRLESKINQLEKDILANVKTQIIISEYRIKEAMKEEYPPEAVREHIKDRTIHKQY